MRVTPKLVMFTLQIESIIFVLAAFFDIIQEPVVLDSIRRFRLHSISHLNFFSNSIPNKHT